MGCGRVLIATTTLFSFVSFCESVTGGQEAAPHSRPYMASIQINQQHECGGFLVAEQWVMTAAHCFPQQKEDIRIILGAHSLTKPEESKQDLGISAIYNHPDFSIQNYDNDIALIKTDRPVVLSHAVKTLKFQREGGTEPQTEAEVSVAGWGSTNNLRSRPDVLHELVVEVMSPKLCARSDYYGTKFTGNMMCASRKRKDTCDGDSGGPLVYKGVAVGITSNGGKKCGTYRKPGVYTIISRYTAWIDRTMTW